MHFYAAFGHSTKIRLNGIQKVVSGNRWQPTLPAKLRLYLAFCICDFA